MKRKRSVKDYLFAHKGNLYKPYIFAAESVMTMLLVLFIFQGIYVFQVGVVAKDAEFTAAVLPAVLTTLTNTDRSAHGLSQLQRDPLLDQAAQAKAQDMATNGYFAHVSPTGKTPWYWLDQMGYKYDYAGENLAVDFTDSIDVEAAWMQSPTHRDNIVKPEYTHIGMATAEGMYQGKQVTFVVEVFATPSIVSVAHDAMSASPEPINVTVSASASSSVIAASSDSAHSVDIQSEKSQPENKILGVQKSAATVSSSAVASGEAIPAPVSQQTAPVPQNTPHANLLVQAVASPANVFQNILLAFIMVIVLLLGMALAVHARMGIQYVEVVGSGALVVGVAVMLMFINGTNVHSGNLPVDGQSASVSMALR